MLYRAPKNELRKKSGIYAEPSSEKKQHWLQADVRNSSFSHVVDSRGSCSEGIVVKFVSLKVWCYNSLLSIIEFQPKKLVGMTIAHVVRKPIYSFGTHKTMFGSLC
jgi:hypothetical protein